MPSLGDLARYGLADVAAVIPSCILDQPAVQLPSPPFGRPSPLMIADPDLARIVLADKARKFGRDRLMQRLMRRSWGKGLAAAEGEAWQAQRRAAQPFFRSSMFKQQADAFSQAAREVCSLVNDGETVDLQELAGRIIARVLLRVLIDAQGEADPDRLVEVLPRYMEVISGFTLTDLLLLPEAAHDFLVGMGRSSAVDTIRTMADNLAAQKDEGTAKEDLIDLLKTAGPIEDNIRGLIPAAMDTTAKGLTWTLFVMAANPELQDRVAASPPQMPPTRSSDIGRIVQEVLRLYPPAPFLIRAAMESMALGEFQVRKGQSVGVSVYAMHRHAAWWDHPAEFRPERFAESAKASPAYLPFGMGPRSCIAAQFAFAEIAVIASEICRVLRLEASGPAPAVGLQVTTHPIGPVMATVRQR